MEGQTDGDTDTDRDRLSDLPDHLLLRIIELIDVKLSVQTCVLAKRWKDLWKSLANLNLLYFSSDNSHIFNKFVSRILSGRDDSVSLHSLNYVHVDVVDPPKATLFEAMQYAASHNVKQLRVVFCTWSPTGYPDLSPPVESLEWPPSLFYCRTLTFLELDLRHPFLSDNIGKRMFPKSLNLPVLKTLFLLNLTFATNENGYAEPFSSFNMLTTLLIRGCYLQDDAQALWISNSNVTRLTAGGSRMIEQADNYKYLFFTPKLISLTITDRPNFLAPCAENLPFLTELKIDYVFFSKTYEDFVLKSWLSLLANVSIITLGFDTLVKIIRVSYFSVQLVENNGSTTILHPCFARLKSLNVKMDSRVTAPIKRVIEMIGDVLINSPLIEVFIFRTGNRDQSKELKECIRNELEA
ncbi:unnamed protein product [Lathyrus oleraceus]|nr:F-box/FBD/LRR-repeat protein At5g56420-like [Pisum sativum]